MSTPETSPSPAAGPPSASSGAAPGAPFELPPRFVLSEGAAGTLRGDFGTDIERNASHGSDAPETARLEISYFFNAGEIQGVVEALPA